jgi:hypothetical protein
VKENKTVFFYFPCVPILIGLVLELYFIVSLTLLDINAIFPSPTQKLVATVNEQYPNACIFLKTQTGMQCLCVS